MDFPISIIYGSHDWMDARGSRQIVSENKFFAVGSSQLHILENAGHQLFMTNPRGFVELLTADCLGIITHEYNPRRYTNQYLDDNKEVIDDNDEFLDVGVEYLDYQIEVLQELQ